MLGLVTVDIPGTQHNPVAPLESLGNPPTHDGKKANGLTHSHFNTLWKKPLPQHRFGRL